MRIMNGIIYVLLIGCLIMAKVLSGEENSVEEKYKYVLKRYWHLWVLLFVVNTISFGMTFLSTSKEIFVKRQEYGGEQQEITLLFSKGEEKQQWQLPVGARMLTEEQLQKRMEEAFLYFEENMRGENTSLDEVRGNLDYSYDYKKFPFDADFVSNNFCLLDEEGMVQNDRTSLLEQGYREQDLEKGIPVILKVTLWYGEESFSRDYSIRIFPKEETSFEQAFDTAKKQIEEEEKKAIYDEGFYVPTEIGDVIITSVDSEGVTPAQVLVAGIIIVALLLLREQENEKQRMKNRRDCLVRSYPWFVNELLLLMGAGMQTRNILKMLMEDYEKRKQAEDYRQPLIDEITVAVQALELGMSEEQVYYKLGRRLGLPCYMKIMTMLEQNVKRGGKGLGLVFEQEEIQALEERKNLAKRLGEEAGTKLLGPMIVLLLAIMLMIMLPAFWGFA